MGYSRIRRQRLLQEAEGYLELLLAVSEPLAGDATHRHRLARRAIQVLDQLDHAEFQHGRAHYLRGQAFRLMEKYHQAVDAFQKAADIDPENVHIMLSLAWCYKRLGCLELAIDTLEDAVVLEPRRSILHYNLACYWSLLGDVEPAVQHLARAFQLNGKYRQMVHEEADFDGVRHHPEFLALAQVIV